MARKKRVETEVAKAGGAMAAPGIESDVFAKVGIGKTGNGDAQCSAELLGVLSSLFPRG